MAHEDSREEKALREKLQRERDQLLSEKYSLEQTLQVSYLLLAMISPYIVK